MTQRTALVSTRVLHCAQVLNGVRMISSARAAAPVRAGLFFCGRMSAEVLLGVIERQFVNPLQKRIVGLIWEQYVAAAAFAHWLFSNEQSLDFDGFFWDDAQLDNDGDDW